ncbi:MAG: DUF1501 domain-containing protein [Gemmataceae bacterium]|nr:DUF1501 domain-containing protein [Gemmataceae bacterium]
MLTFLESSHRPCDGVSRREFFKVGALGLGALTLSDLLRLKAVGATEEKATPKSIIMVYLPGGPSHIDMYDLKPDAPVEFRGEFKPIQTNVAGMDICELMPLQAKIADKFSIVRGLQSVDTHSAEMLMRGSLGGPTKRPVFGSVVSRMRGGAGANGMPHYVSLGGENGSDPGDPAYLGAAHKPFSGGQAMSNLSLHKDVNATQLADRKQLLKAFDNLNREIDTRAGDIGGMDTFNQRALEIISSTKVRDAFDINKESQQVRDHYGKNATRFLQARRLVEAGVSVVTCSAAGTMFPGGDWDTHAGGDQKSETNFSNLRRKLPEYDKAVHALVTDIYERGLDKDVAVVVWGEFGRTPKINKTGGRDHWAPAGNVFIAGGGLKMGQVVGDTGLRAERSKGTVYTPSNVLSTLYRVLGIDPETTLPDFMGRPMYLLDEREPIAELV